MKTAFLYALLLVLQQSILAQPRLFLASHHKTHYVIELTEQSGVVYKIVSWSRHHLAGVELIETDTLHWQGEQYLGKTYKLQKEEGNFQLRFKTAHNRQKKFRLDSVQVGRDLHLLMNEGYWYGNFHKAYAPFKVIYPSRFTGNYKAWKYWSSFRNQRLDYKDFQAFANGKLAVIRDSVYKAEIKYIQPVFNLLDSATLLTIPQLAIRFDSLRANRNGTYFDAAATNLCQQNPETFLQLAEYSSVIKKDLFRSVYHHKKSITALKAVPDHRATKKEFARRRTGYAVKEGVLLTAVGIVALIPYALITWGIVALVSK